ncbi:type II CRISPR RNA-guided endonuclease Cas9 [Membranihabitans marinus]|uniref:type II CRISPR RNA-guided endonuclease Cas9 n=1 Tax=Membranihabitans marinus TaxID=1227546 RepID=UPI001EECF540|nr:type II CRISPR RNA-guided endonuclease Cas9 [Membranihabitans marinus]
MGKKILGLDLGTTSIGWALVEEADREGENSRIIKLGVRVNPLSADEQSDFEKGNPLSLNADRTLKRGARRNLQRFKLRRKNLIEVMANAGWIDSNFHWAETGKNTTFESLKIRAKAASEKVSLEELARVLLSINKKRGYKSSRKAKNEEEGSLIDGMAVAKEMYENNLLPGQYVYNQLKSGKQYIPDFYRSDLQRELDAVWEFQKEFHPNILTDEFRMAIAGKGQKATAAMWWHQYQFNTAENKVGSREDKKLQAYKWRNDALHMALTREEVAYVITEINHNLNSSSGYLGAISDRSKILYFNDLTFGQYLYQQVCEDSHTRLKGQVFYRQDYLDEFEKIWSTQQKYYPQLNEDLKSEIRDVVIFYQRRLKSQKGLIGLCEFEQKTITITKDGKEKKKIIGPRAIPKSSPLFQEFKIRQQINLLELRNNTTGEKYKLNASEREALFEELFLRGNMKKSQLFKFFNWKEKDWTINIKSDIEGNRSNQALFNVYQAIAEMEGYGFDWAKKKTSEILEELKAVFPVIGIDPSVLDYDSSLETKEYQKQKSFQLWHLLYSAEDDMGKIAVEDVEKYGQSSVALKKVLHQKFGFKIDHTHLLAQVVFQNDYGNLSSKAIRKILPGLKQGLLYSDASKLAGYNHSNSLNKEERAQRVLSDYLEILPKNSLRNPVVEKILNQMVNLVNQVIDTYGKPDEVRIELARELKKSAKERSEMTKNINAAKRLHEDYVKTLRKPPFNIANPTRGDIIKYKLYLELSGLRYYTIYTNKHIEPEMLYSKDVEIEHIIPQSRLFDDSFANKTLAFSKINREKGNMTALDYIEKIKTQNLDGYLSRVELLYSLQKISRTKYRKLIMRQEDIPKDFIERDLRNSQYIAKKAKEMLEEVIDTVNTSTGKITSLLREDWNLINVMKELNLPKYRAAGRTSMEERKYGQKVEKIEDWTKRNDHRHHALDALTVAFTTYNHVQYINNLNADSNRDHSFEGKKNIITKNYVNGKGHQKRKFIPPMENFRQEAKRHLEGVLVSFKTKNKVVTRNFNRVKGCEEDQLTLTPRGQLHKETIYGRKLRPVVKEEKIGTKWDMEKISQVTNPVYRNALERCLFENDENPKKAFGGKNSPTKKPIVTENNEVIPEKVKTVSMETYYTIRKEVAPDLKIDKVVDDKIKKLLNDHLATCNNDAKLAFGDLEKNPIWQNKEKGIAIKRVTITGVKEVESLHQKKDHLGQLILDEDQRPQPVDFVSTGNNHHVAIYRDDKGKLQEKVVSLYEAVARVNEGLPVVDRDWKADEGWEFLFTLKQNEMFLFPTEEFDPHEVDLFDPQNYGLISPHLFRVQKITSKDYFFRHHLETNVETIKELHWKTWIRTGLVNIGNIIKIRTNHLGDIVQIGEY